MWQHYLHIMGFWYDNAKAENRPTAKELYQKLEKLHDEYEDDSQVDEYDDKIKLNRSNEKRSSNTKTHPYSIYISRLLSFKNLSELINLGNLICFIINIYLCY
jgi:hypothetical protein